jgi:hypothetical protein
MDRPKSSDFEINVKHIFSVNPENGNIIDDYFRCDKCGNFFLENEVIFSYNDTNILLDRRITGTICINCIASDKIETDVVLLNAGVKNPRKTKINRK